MRRPLHPHHHSGSCSFAQGNERTLDRTCKFSNSGRDPMCFTAAILSSMLCARLHCPIACGDKQEASSPVSVCGRSCASPTYTSEAASMSKCQALLRVLLLTVLEASGHPGLSQGLAVYLRCVCVCTHSHSCMDDSLA